MLAFHYTSRQFLPRIQQQGITQCVVPWKMDAEGNVGKMRGVQWLTLAQEFDDQSWAEPSLFAAHQMRKTDYRLMIDIPRLAEHLVVPWRDFARHHGLPVATYFETFPDVKWWLVLRGTIPKKWIVAVTRNPTRYEVPNLIEG